MLRLLYLNHLRDFLGGFWVNMRPQNIQGVHILEVSLRILFRKLFNRDAEPVGIGADFGNFRGESFLVGIPVIAIAPVEDIDIVIPGQVFLADNSPADAVAILTMGLERFPGNMDLVALRGRLKA